MEQTIKIGDKSVRLNNNVGWMICYRDQFGKDIIPTLMPAVAGALDVMSGLINEVGKTDNISLGDLAKITDGNYFVDAMIHIGSLEMVDFINITWALAKSADDSIPDPKEWAKQFDEFPLDEVAPAVFKLVLRGVVSSKNMKRLETLKISLQPSNLTTSSSQEQSED